MKEPLQDFSITHAGIKPLLHPRLKTTVNGQTAVRYLRFLRPVRVQRLELPYERYGRWVPGVPTHPAHLIISVLDPRSRRWKVISEVDLPRDPDIEGEGLSQRMTTEQMDAHFAQVLKKKPRVIELRGLETDHLRVECDREHPMWPNHGECNGGEFNVPFGALNPLKAFGKPLAKEKPEPKYLPILARGVIRPVAPKAMTVRREPTMLVFASRKLSVGFSLERPMLLHLGWDFFGKGRAGRNRLVASKSALRAATIGGLSGPSLRTLTDDCLSHHWTGDVTVRGSQVAYRNLRCAVEGVRLDAVFTVEPERISLQLTQTCDREIVALESFAWRLAWDIEAAMTGAMAMPTLRPGRNGDVYLPMLWAGDGIGCLSCRVLEGDARLQIESYRCKNGVVGGLALADGIIPAGRREATIELAVANVEPKGSRRPSFGVVSHWSAIYSCFRPEYGGFSNQAVSVNCHVNQHGPAEVVAFTRKPTHGPNPLDLYRFTIERALLDGGGYGYWRNLYLDSDPILLSGAGRIHQTEPNRGWLRRIEPGVVETVRRIFGTLGKEGLAVCRALSGNAGSFRWSSNAMDVVGFGHMDAYVNAWTYRGLRNAAALLANLGQRALADECRDRAAELKRAFPKFLVNPRMGWVAGWRSRDGELHDYAFTWVNGPACAFGLLDPPAARRAMLNLEKLRDKVGAGSGVCSIPFNLLPIRRDDHMLPKIFDRTMPTFEMYTDGAKAACAAPYYLRSLSIHGLKDRARKLARELDEGFAAGLWCGGTGSGVEFRCWDGVPSGYEGTFVASFSALYGIAIEQGLFDPPDPEWWPDGG